MRLFICKVVTPHTVIGILDFYAMQFFMIVIRLELDFDATESIKDKFKKKI